MEVQVNVARDAGSPVEGMYKTKYWQGFTDGMQTWKHFRIPWNAADQPIYQDTEIPFDISVHAEAIGMTGWNWVQKSSEWFGFDFDSLINHKQGLSDEEIETIRSRLGSINWVSLYRSTSGSGLHVYIFTNFKGISTHTEHAAISKALINKLSAITGIDLCSKVDVMGGNMWVWHRKAKPEISYECLKQGEKLLEIPPNWQLFIPQIKQRRPKLEHTEQDIIAAGKVHVKLTQDHLKLIHWFERSSSLWWWDETKQMLVCHTADLKQVFVELQLKGMYETLATGKDHGHDQNCFVFPLDNGWIARRHTRGITEATTWFLDSSGWTTCYFDRFPDLITSSRLFGGIELDKSIIYSNFLGVTQTLNSIGIDCKNELILNNRSSEITKLKDGKLLISVEAADIDSAIDGWVKRKGKWQRTFIPLIREDIETPDHLVRHITANNTPFGWFLFTNNAWISEDKSNIITALLSKGTKRETIEIILGTCIFKNWKLVNKPFQSEYPGNREWNRDAAQLRFEPTNGQHPTWDLIFNHCGKSLDDAIRINEWCLDNRIVSGASYLLAWCASIIQEPFTPTPYLFITGPQNCGKSIFHEALNLLFTKGYIRADNALINPAGFNGELATAILCIVEETNLSKKNKSASDRIKDWTTGRTLNIHIKNRTPYDIPNCTHWIQCANSADYCPILPGDTRITMFNMGMPDKEIPKHIILQQCEQEAAAFINTLISFELSETIGRLKIPVIITQQKLDEQEFNEDLLIQFFKDRVYNINGSKILLNDLYNAFIIWLPSEERSNWTSRRVAKNLPPPYIKGRWGGEGQVYIGNASFENRDLNLPKFIIRDNRLIPSLT